MDDPMPPEFGNHPILKSFNYSFFVSFYRHWTHQYIYN
jgi:hypothetical protein